jgi:heterodisulfide reductase subunit B
MNLDMRQEDTGIGARIPIVYFTQLMGLAFGLDHEALGLERHYVSTTPLLGRL